MDVQEILPVKHPVRGTVRPPGSKSITNRAFVLAALADGPVRLTGVLDSQDTQVMVESLRRLGFDVQQDQDACTCLVQGLGGNIPASSADLWLENSGTSIRFLAGLCTLGTGRYRLDGSAPCGSDQSVISFGHCARWEQLWTSKLPEVIAPPC